jgi:hypothetical protein
MATVRVRKCGICKLTGHNSRTCPLRALQAAEARLAQATAQAEAQAEAHAEAQAAEQVSSEQQGKSNLGLLNIGGRQVFTSLLPSQAESVIVKYQPEIQVSCVIPPQKFAISYAYSRSTRNKKTLDVTTPTLIMSCGYGDVPTPRAYQRVTRAYSLWSIDTARKDQIYAKPYLFANVWEQGKICFGGLKPSSLRQAYNYYWTSSFNAELYREAPGIIHSCGNKVHDFLYHNGHKCDPTKKRHTCSCPRVTFHQHSRSNGARGGCGCTSVGRSKLCRGTCDFAEETACDCCCAIKAVQAEARLADPTISQRKLNKLAIVENADYPGCGCNYRHKRGCACGKSACNCECFCACCTKTCNHEVCVCACCKDTCACRCRCSVDMRFTQHLEIYHEKLIQKQKWKKRSELFCGTKFWASPKGGHGVLLTNDRTLLNQVPKKFWRKDQNSHAFLVALANKKSDGNWHFESGGFTFELPERSVLAR